MTVPAGDPASSPGGRGVRTRVRLSAAAVLVLVFVAGMGIGWTMARRPHAPQRRNGGPPSPFGMIGGRDLVTRLQLTTAESLAIDSAFKRRLPQADAFWRGPGAQWRAILDSTRADMRAALPPQKRVMFDSLMARGRQRPPPARS